MLNPLARRPEQAPRSSGKLRLVVCFLLFTFSGKPAFAEQSAQPRLPGDFNRDGTVDGDDLEQWRTDFSKSPDSDADQDGDSDGFDFLTWQRFFGSQGGNKIPEPSTVGLLLFPTLYHLGLRRIRPS